MKSRIFIFVCGTTYSPSFAQGDIQAKYEGIDKDTPIPTDRQVHSCLKMHVTPYTSGFNLASISLFCLFVHMLTD